MQKSILYILVFCFICGCAPTKRAKESKILIFCASSLTNVVSEICEKFEKKYQIDTQVNFASSGTLARQIENGAHPSVFISANKKWVDYLNEKGKTIPECERKFAENSLVVIAPLESRSDSFTFISNSNFPMSFKGRLSVGDPRHVPAGEYTIQALNSLGVEKELHNRLLPAKDVRSALLIVELGEAEAGIVYKTDALKSEKVKIVAEIPSLMHSPIIYIISVLKDCDKENTELFIEFLSSDVSKDVLEKNGFKNE